MPPTPLDLPTEAPHAAAAAPFQSPVTRHPQSLGGVSAAYAVALDTPVCDIQCRPRTALAASAISKPRPMVVNKNRPLLAISTTSPPSKPSDRTLAVHIPERTIDIAALLRSTMQSGTPTSIPLTPITTEAPIAAITCTSADPEAGPVHHKRKSSDEGGRDQRPSKALKTCLRDLSLYPPSLRSRKTVRFVELEAVLGIPGRGYDHVRLYSPEPEHVPEPFPTGPVPPLPDHANGGSRADLVSSQTGCRPVRAWRSESAAVSGPMPTLSASYVPRTRPIAAATPHPTYPISAPQQLGRLDAFQGESLLDRDMRLVQCLGTRWIRGLS